MNPKNPNQIADIKYRPKSPYNAGEFRRDSRKKWARNKKLTIRVYGRCTINAQRLAAKTPNVKILCIEKF